MKFQGSMHAIVFAAPAFVLALFASGCVATAAPSPPRGVVVSGPPPQPILEARTAPPGPSAAWVEGYWHWSGAQYAWIPGHWETAAPGARWYAPRYVSADGAYIYEPGGWQGAAPPQPLSRPAAPARASSFR